MPVLYFYENPRGTREMYERVRAQVMPAGLLPGSHHHFGCLDENGGVVIVEVWESEAAHDAWDAKIREAILKAGGPQRPAPRKFPVHNMLSAPTTA